MGIPIMLLIIPGLLMLIGLIFEVIPFGGTFFSILFRLNLNSQRSALSPTSCCLCTRLDTISSYWQSLRPTAAILDI